MDVVDVMTRHVVTTTPDSTIRQAARLMLDGGFSGLPVIEDGRLIGVLSEADFVARDGSPTWLSRVLFGDEERPLAGVQTVAEIMTTPAVTIDELSTVQEAARVMTRRGLKRLPVVSHGGELVGIVTRRDLIASYVRPDEDIAGEVETLLAVLPSPLSHVEVSVADGVVTLSGEVDSADQSKTAGRVARGVEGVVRVVSRLDWEIEGVGDYPGVGSLN